MSIHPTCIYGFNEGNLNYILDFNILEDNGMSYYLSEINMKSLSEIIYGIECEFNQLTGQLLIHENKKKIVDKLYEKVLKYKIHSEDEHHNHRNFIVPEIGYYICLNGEGLDYSYYKKYSINE